MNDLLKNGWLCLLLFFGCNSTETKDESTEGSEDTGTITDIDTQTGTDHVTCRGKYYSVEDDYMNIDPRHWEYYDYDPMEMADKVYGTWTGTYPGDENVEKFDFTLTLKSAADSADQEVKDKYFRVVFPVCPEECTAEDYDVCVHQRATVSTRLEFQSEIEGTKIDLDEKIYHAISFSGRSRYTGSDFPYDLQGLTGTRIENLPIESMPIIDVCFLDTAKVYMRPVFSIEVDNVDWLEIANIQHTP